MQANPGKQHGGFIKEIFRYIAGTCHGELLVTRRTVTQERWKLMVIAIQIWKTI